MNDSTETNKANLQRVVCFKFKYGISPETIQGHIAGFDALKKTIPYILSHQAGMTIQGELKDKPEYDVMHYMTFRNEYDIQLYYDHPTHLQFFEKYGETWEKFFVVNSRLV